MEVTLNTTIFKNALNKVSTILDQEEIKLNNYVKLTTNDHSLNIRANNTDGAISVNIEADTKENGTVTVSAKLINMLVSKLETETISLKTTSNNLSLNSEGIKADLRILENNIVEYPCPNDTQKIKINGKELSQALNSCIPFCSEKSTNGLQGVNIQFQENKLKTTGFSSSLGTVYEGEANNETETTLLISKKCANILSELCKEADTEEIILETKNSLIFFKDNQTLFTGRLLNANYPQVDRLFQNNGEKKKTINKQKLFKALERINCFIPSDTKTPVIIETSKGNNTMIISVQTDLGKNTESIEFEGLSEDKIIALNCDYLMKVLRKANNETIDLYINDGLHPAFIFTPKNKFAISPVRNNQVLEKMKKQEQANVYPKAA